MVMKLEKLIHYMHQSNEKRIRFMRILFEFSTLILTLLKRCCIVLAGKILEC